MTGSLRIAHNSEQGGFSLDPLQYEHGLRTQEHDMNNAIGGSDRHCRVRHQENEAVDFSLVSPARFLDGCCTALPPRLQMTKQTLTQQDLPLYFFNGSYA